MNNEERKPKIFIVVLNYNGGKLLRNCLGSLANVTYPNFSIIVADNDSKDDSLKMVREEFPKVVVIENKKNLGFATGNNVGVRYALENGADYVLLLNQDTEVEPDFLEKLIVVGEKNPQVGILSPLIFWKRTKEIWFSGGKINWLTMKSFHEKNLRTGAPYTTGFITGCSILIKKKVLEKIGSLSENFFLYWEDADFSYQAKKADFTNLVVPESRIYHFEVSNLPTGKKLYWLVLSGLIFFKRNSTKAVYLWIKFYTFLRRTKNWFDVRLRPNENNLAVQEAYKDFNNGKFQ
jgi:hypothetical protein